MRWTLSQQADCITASQFSVSCAGSEVPCVSHYLDSMSGSDTLEVIFGDF